MWSEQRKKGRREEEGEEGGKKGRREEGGQE